MKSLANAVVHHNLRARVKRSYGMGRISIEQHNVCLRLIDMFERAAIDPKYAAKLGATLKSEVPNGNATPK